jgi:hypothetical protein
MQRYGGANSCQQVIGVLGLHKVFAELFGPIKTMNVCLAEFIKRWDWPFALLPGFLKYFDVLFLQL